MALDPGFWRGRRVFLTGHTGFKGGWLLLWLDALGAKVHGYSLAPDSKPAFWHEAQLDTLVQESVLEDIRNADKLKQAMHKFAPDIVFHLAAQPLVRASYRDPVETYSTNVMGTLNLLEAIRMTSSVQAVVVVTTDKCYENIERPLPYCEQDSLGGHDPYSSSKACAELLCASYRRSFLNVQNIRLATARAGNVIGGGDWSVERLLPDILSAWQKKQNVVLRSPSAIRPWQHVLEALYGYLCLAQKLVEQPQMAACAWNFGPDNHATATVQTVVEQTALLWGKEARWSIASSASLLHEAGFLSLDSSKARAQLGWQPVWTLEQALTATVAWHKAWAVRDNMQQFTLQQIRDYQDSINE